MVKKRSKRSATKSAQPLSPSPSPAIEHESGPWMGIALGYFILLVTLSSIAFPRSLWGTAAPSAYSLPVQLAGLALAGVSFLPAADRFLEKVISAKQFPFGAAAVGIFLVVFAWMNRIQLNWMGDQRLWIRDVENHDTFHPIEPLSYELVEQSHHNLEFLVGKNGERLFSAALGGLFLILTWRLSKQLAPQDRLRQRFLWLGLSAAPQYLFYFGYIESYPFLLLAMLTVAWLALRAVRGGSVWLAWTSAFLAASTHIIGAGSAAAVALSSWFRKQRVAAILGTVALGAAVLWWLEHVDTRASYFINEPKLTWMIFDPGDGWSRFMSWGHLRDTFNIILVSGGPALWLAPFLPWRTLWKQDRNTILVFLALAAPGIAGLLFLRMLLGAPRDWDLFSSYLYFLPAVVLWGWMRTRGSGKLPRFSAALVTLGLLHAGYWVGVDLDYDRGMARATVLYGSGSNLSRKAISQTAEELGSSARDRRMYDLALKWVDVCIDLVPAHWRYYNVYASTAARKGDLDLAAEFFQKAIERKPTLNAPYTNLGNIHLLRGQFQEAREVYAQGLRERGEHPDWYAGMGAALTGMQELDEATEILNKGIAAYPQHSLLRIQRGIAMHNSGEFDDAVRDLRLGLQGLPTHQNGWRALEFSARAIGDEELARQAQARFAALTGATPP